MTKCKLLIGLRRSFITNYLLLKRWPGFVNVLKKSLFLLLLISKVTFCHNNFQPEIGPQSRMMPMVCFKEEHHDLEGVPAEAARSLRRAYYWLWRQNRNKKALEKEGIRLVFATSYINKPASFVSLEISLVCYGLKFRSAYTRIKNSFITCILVVLRKK